MLAFAAYCVLALGVFEITRLFTGDRDMHRERAKRKIAGRVLDILGVRRSRAGASEDRQERARLLEHRGRHRAKAPLPRLIVSNHRTALDIGVLMSELGGSFLSRADLADWPVAGRMAKRADTIFVDRESRGSGAMAIRTIRRRLREGGSVIVFPEGTTYAGDEVRPFRGGAFVATRGLETEILPVGIAYPLGVEYVGQGFVEHVRSVAARPSTPVQLVVGLPFRCEGTTSEVAEKTHEIVQALVLEARRLLEMPG